MADNFDASKPSQGFGDTIAKITHAIGADKVAEGVARAMGREDCGCNRRREVLNKLFPYRTSTTPTPIPTPVNEAVYTYEGTRNFKVLVPLTADPNNGIIAYETGTILSISNSDPLYSELKTLLQNHSIEPV